MQQVSVSFEDGKGVRSQVRRYDLRSYSEALDVKDIYRSKQSFGLLQVEVLLPRADTRISVIINGREVLPRRFVTTALFSVKLDYDLMFHRIAVIVLPSKAINLEVFVEHYYKPTGWSESPGLLKWSLDQLSLELEKYLSLFGVPSQQTVLPDLSHCGVGERNENSAQVLLQLIGRIEQLVLTSDSHEVCVDFNEEVLGGFDLDAILSKLKSQPLLLTSNPRGVISISGSKYTTTVSTRLKVGSSKVSIDELPELLETFAVVLSTSPAPMVASILLRNLAEEVRIRYPGRKRGGYKFDHLLLGQMKSPFGSSLQFYLRALLGLINNTLGRTTVHHRLNWLSQSIRDRDVYQTSVFASCAKSLGFNHQQVLDSNGLIATTNIVVADVNRPSGFEYFKSSISSWRSDSIQPSDYKPDILVSVAGAVVVIDAKFRMPNSALMVAAPEGLKDVQAYLNDFGIATAIVVVPKILCKDKLCEEGYALIHNGGNRIFVVEMQDSDSVISQRALRRAIELAAIGQDVESGLL